MAGIVEFLNARLNEDVVIAFMGEEWSAEDWEAAAGSGIVATHIARHDPARALREVTAKRQILAAHPDDEGQCERCLDSDGIWHENGRTIAYTAMYPCDTVRALAAVYADHPDYRTDW